MPISRLGVVAVVVPCVEAVVSRAVVVGDTVSVVISVSVVTIVSDMVVDSRPQAESRAASARMASIRCCCIGTPFSRSKMPRVFFPIEYHEKVASLYRKCKFFLSVSKKKLLRLSLDKEYSMCYNNHSSSKSDNNRIKTGVLTAVG